MRGVQTLLGNIPFQQCHPFRRHVVQDLLGQIIFTKQRDGALDRPTAETLLLRPQIQYVVNGHVEQGRVGGFVVSSVAKLPDEQQAGH